MAFGCRGSLFNGQREASARSVARLVGLGLAVLLFASKTLGLGFTQSSMRGSVPGDLGQQHLGASAPQGRSGRVLSSPSLPAATGPRAIYATTAMASAAAMLLLLSQKRASAMHGEARSSSRVILCAKSPFPSTPVGVRNSRRVRAGRKRPIFRGRQIMVRVNMRTNKPIRYRMHVSPGDVVQVMKGKDKGKVTEVLRVFPKWNRVLCLGVNYCIKHVRPMREDEVGQRVQVEAPMHVSNVMHYSEKEGVVGLLGMRYDEVDGKMVKIRFNKATGEPIPKKKPKKWTPVLDRVSAEAD